MAIKPILFNTEMVRAILDGRKTYTRRICKDANEYTVPDMDFYNADRRTYAVHNFADKEHTEQLSIAERTCPICPGDTLYVRETWMDYAGLTMYKADCDIYRLDSLNFAGFGWKPSIHMPKEAARIWLKVTNVRVERLQEITEDGAKAEGAKQCYEQINTIEDKPVTYVAEDYKGYYVLGFKSVWNSTIKKSDIDRYGWDANPWVLVIEFERCEKPDDA